MMISPDRARRPPSLIWSAKPLGVVAPVPFARLEGLSIAEMLLSLEADLARRGETLPDWNSLVVVIGDAPVDRALWARVRPKARDAQGRPVTVAVMRRHAGGRAGKQILGVVALIALIVFAAYAAPLIAGATIFGVTITGQAAFAAITAIGSLAISALTSIPAKEARGLGPVEVAVGEASASGNILARGAAIPAVIGEMKIYPPLIGEPLVEVVGNDQIVTAVYALAGPHRWSDIRINGAPVETMPGVGVETREGWPGDLPLSSVQRYAKTDNLSLKLTRHDIDPEGSVVLLKTPSAPASSLPQWARVTSATDPDEIWLTLAWNQGLVDGDAPTADQQQAIRLRMRPKGADDAAWRNLPELHITNREVYRLIRQVRIRWATAPALPTPKTQKTFILAYWSVPDQNVGSSPADGAWLAHPHFQGTAASGSDSRNAALYEDRAEIFVSSGYFPRGEAWEIEVMASYVFVKASFIAATYNYLGSIRNFFGYQTFSAPAVHVTQKNRQGDIDIAALASVVNDPPAPSGAGLALIAIRGKNVRVDKVSVVAGRYVPDWDGADWTDWGVTSNPAPHLRDILVGEMTAPLRRQPPRLIDDAAFLAWRTWCADWNHQVNYVADGQSIAGLAQVVAGAGRARLSRGETISVFIDNDRSADAPVQAFTPLNSADLQFRKEFTPRIDGLRVNFRNRALDYETDETIVLDGALPTDRAPNLENATYEGIVDLWQVVERARFDLAQRNVRSMRWTLRADIEAIVCAPGSLVAIAHDALEEFTAAARVRRITGTAGAIAGVELDRRVMVWNEPPFWSVADLWVEEDFWSIGRVSGAAVRAASNPVTATTFTAPLANATGETADLVFAAPVAADIREDDIVAVGPLTREYRRALVAAPPVWTREETCTLALVDEGPELHVAEREGWRPWADGALFLDGIGWAAP